MGDNEGDTRWMTYAELAQARGIKEPAAVRLVQRRGWERHQANDGAARIAVPVAELRPSKPVTPAVMPVVPDSQAEAAAALVRERARADRAEARADEAHAAAERAGREREAASIRAAAAEGEAAALREALTFARRPAWRRWLGID